MALNRAAINNSSFVKNTTTQSTDTTLVYNSDVGSIKPVEVTVDPNTILIDRGVLGKSSIQSPNLSKTVVENSYVAEKSDSTSFTSKLINFIEPYDFKGKLKTVFYSEISTNFNVGDKVFISNGYYDSPVKVSYDKYAKGVDGYEILAIDGCKIVLDLDYTGRKPYNDMDLKDFIFVHNVTSQQEFEYLNTFKKYIIDNRIFGEIKSSFLGESDGTKTKTWGGHFIRVGSSDNFTRSTLMTSQSIFGFLSAGADGTNPRPARNYGCKIFYRTFYEDSWFDCSQDFANNNIQLLDAIDNPGSEIGNKKVYTFGPDFEFNGTTFKEGIVYSFNNETGKWEMDQNYKPAYISKLYFIEGTFVGNHRAGLFGTYNKNNVWEGKGEWVGGTVLNSIWKSGRMDSKTKVGDVVVRAKLSSDGKSVIQSVDTTNNSGTGYNEIVDSIVEGGSFYNANFKNCFLGKTSGESAMEIYFNEEDPATYFGLYTNSSRVDFCDIKDTILSSTTIYDSFVNNSNLVGSKLSNGQIKSSVFDGGEYNADSGITILGAEINSYDRDIGNQNNNTNIYGILKLFISDQDFFRFSKGDSFYIEKVNKEFFVSSLDEHFRIHLPYETKYILDLYWDYEFSDDDPLKPNSVSVRDKRQNRYKFYVAKNETSQLFIQKATPIVGPYWEDVTANWKGAWDPNNYGGQIIGFEWFYVFYDYFTYQQKLGEAQVIAIQEEIEFVNPDLPELPVPEDPGTSLGNQTFHIFRSRIINPGEVGKPGLGPNINADGYTPYFGWERVNDELMEKGAVDGPFISTAAGQYRGEFSTDPSTIALSIAGGLSYYQIGDVVEFFNPETLEYSYYRALQDMPQQIEIVTYDIIDYLVADPNTKIGLSENSSFANYCSIDIESTLLGFIRTTTNGVTTDNWINSKFLTTGFESLMPAKLIDKIFRNVQVKNAHFDSGIFINSKWTSGSYINDYGNIIGKQIGTDTKLNMSQVNDENNFRIRKYSSFNNNKLKIGDYVWIDPITYVFGAVKQELSGPYYIKSLSPNDTAPVPFKDVLMINPLISFNSVVNGVFSVLNSELTSHASISKLRIENSIIYGGKFRRANFYNSTFRDKVNYTKPANNLIDPKEVPLLINQIFSKNNLKVENGFIYQSQILDLSITGGYLYFNYLNGATISGGEFRNGYWVNGTLAGGKFLDCRENNTVSVRDTYLVDTFRDRDIDLKSLWLKGKFLSGEFYNSEWVDGVFENGKFWKSDWFGGTWSNGIFGDKSIPYTDTTFAYYPQKTYPGKTIPFGNTLSNWYDGECQNGLIGGNGRVHWYGGRMVGGEFTSFDYNSNTQSIWYDGIFDGSIFTEYAKWKNGTFNNGKFLSILGSETIHYEDTFPTTYKSIRTIDSKNAANFNTKETYGWEYGIFNGGEFGSANQAKNKNSIWFDGIFNGGIFQGRLWKNGIFSGGKFYGKGGIKDLNDSSLAPDPEAFFFHGFTNYQTITALPWQSIPAFGNFYGLWFDGYVVENPVEIYSDRKVESELVRATDVKKPKQTVLFENVLWNTGTFSHENATIKDSIFVNGNFVRGYHDGGVFNPYVNRTFDYDNPDSFSFSAPNLIKWTNGTFVTGSFYCSVWENGLWKEGYMAGSHWKDGTWEYGRADNIFWDGGTWKNGNWYGAPFGSDLLQQVGSNVVVEESRQKYIILSTDYFMSLYTNRRISSGNDPIPNKSYIFMSNLFSASVPKIRMVRLNQFKDNDISPTTPNPCGGSGTPLKSFGQTFLEYWTFNPNEQNTILRTVAVKARTPYYVTDYVQRQASQWKHAPALNYVSAVTTVYDSITDTTYDRPVLGSWDNDCFSDHYVTDFSTFDKLTNVISGAEVAPYKRGYNNLYKGTTYNFSDPNNYLDPPILYNPPEDIVINTQDSAPSARVFARRGGSTATTSVFTQSNVLNIMELYLSVELAKEVTVDVWVGGLSYSTFNLKSYEFYYPDDKKKDGTTTITTTEATNAGVNFFRTDYYPRFYKIKLTYYSSDELLSLKDGKFFWVRKSSFGILRLYRWTITEQYVSYHPTYNNVVYPSIDTTGTSKNVMVPFDATIKYSSNSRQNLPVSINFGNGFFRQGIWESGIWNNGLRANSFAEGFFVSDDILKSNEIISVVRGVEETQWYITIKFLESVTDYQSRGYKLRVGGKVSVSNLASYDTTGKRRVIYSIFEVVDIDFTNNIIKILYKTQNSISTISRDSEKHLIYLTTNIWKNGAFLNGVFRGIFNNGIVLSNPFHADFVHTHMLNGYFDGGHFISNFEQIGNLQYQTSLIQDMDFFDRNIATRGNKRFRTWFDLIWTNTSKSHIKKTGSVVRSKRLAGQAYGSWLQPTVPFNTSIMVPKLTGYITDDVLKSTSTFRELESYDTKVYSLGTKKTRFNNAYPNDGKFDKALSSLTSTLTLGGVLSVTTQGITFSLLRQQARTTYTINRAPFTFSVESNTTDQNNGLLQINVGEPDNRMHNWTLLLKNNQVSTLPDRYYEFSMKLFNQTTFGGKIYMDDVAQYVNQSTFGPFSSAGALTPGDLTPSNIADLYINHAKTPFEEKVEYFYNKNNVDIFFDIVSPFTPVTDADGTSLNPQELFPPGPSAIYIENISLYEVDMIPFFSYFTYSEIDQSVNSQYYAIAPKIESQTSDFEFVDDDKLKVTYELLLSQNPVANIVNVLPTFSDVTAPSIGTLASPGTPQNTSIPNGV